MTCILVYRTTYAPYCPYQQKYKEDIFSDAAQYPTMNTDKISAEEVWSLKNRAVRKFFFRPSYIIKRILKTRSLYDFLVQARVAISFLQNMRK